VSIAILHDWDILERKSKSSSSTVFLVYRVIHRQGFMPETEYMSNHGTKASTMRRRCSVFRSRIAAEKAIAKAACKCRHKETEMTATHPLAAAVLQQEAGEPVAKPFGWYGESRFDNDFTTNEDTSRRWHANGYRLTPLYATPQVSPPQARVPQARVDALNPYDHAKGSRSIWDSGFRAAERAHRIGLETKE
jgi:hypothetical protein